MASNYQTHHEKKIEGEIKKYITDLGRTLL